MNPGDFDSKMSRALSSLTSLREHLQGDPGLDTYFPAEAIEELAVALEELHVADGEVRAKSEQLAVSQQRYRQLFDLAPDAYVVTDREGIIAEANQAAVRLLDQSQRQLAGRPLAGHVVRGRRPDFYHLLNAMKRGDPILDQDLEFESLHDAPIAASCSITLTHAGPEDRPALLWLIRDISERKNAQRQLVEALAQEQALRARLETARRTIAESEARFRLALEHSPIAVFSMDRDLRVTWAHNPGLGWPAAEIIGKTAAELFEQDDAERLVEIKRRVLVTGERRQVQVALHTRQGDERFFDLAVEPLRDASDQIVGLTCVSVDITERYRERNSLKSANVELDRLVAKRTREVEQANAQLRRLAHQIISTQEEERRRVSRELHDEAGQALTALKMSLEAIRIDLPADPDLTRRVDELVHLTAGTMEELRLLAHDLRPPALDAATLTEVFAGLCAEYARRMQVPVEYHGVSVPELGKPESTTLYRFLQESLTNINKHAQATAVQVMLESDAEGVTLHVRDNGRGFDPSAIPPYGDPDHGIGLIGIQERLRSVGGTLEIESQIGHGTQLAAHVPSNEGTLFTE